MKNAKWKVLAIASLSFILLLVWGRYTFFFWDWAVRRSLFFSLLIVLPISVIYFYPHKLARNIAGGILIITLISLGLGDYLIKKSNLPLVSTIQQDAYEGYVTAFIKENPMLKDHCTFHNIDDNLSHSRDLDLYFECKIKLFEENASWTEKFYAKLSSWAQEIYSSPDFVIEPWKN